MYTSTHGVCYDESQSGNCGLECECYLNGECEIEDEIKETTLNKQADRGIVPSDYQDCKLTGKINLNDPILSGKPIIGFDKNPFLKPRQNDMADTLALSMEHIMLSKEAGFYKNTVEKKIKNEFDLNKLSRVIEETYSINPKYKKQKEEKQMSFQQLVTVKIVHQVNGQDVETMSKETLKTYAIEIHKRTKELKHFATELGSTAIEKELILQKKVLKKVVKYLDAKK